MYNCAMTRFYNHQIPSNHQILKFSNDEARNGAATETEKLRNGEATETEKLRNGEAIETLKRRRHSNGEAIETA